MANWGQEGSFFGENVGEANLPSYMNLGTDFDPTGNFDWSVYLASPQNPTLETEFNSHQRGQPAERIHQISSSGQPSSDQTNINVPTTPIRKKKTQEQLDRHNESCRKSRKKKNNEVTEMKKKMKELEDEKEKKKMENAELEHANVSMKRDILSLTDEKVQLESNLKTLQQQRDKQDAFLQELLKDIDLKKLIKEGDKHDMMPTQDQSPSDEESHSEKEISAGNLDGGDSEDYNDYKKKKKRAARSAPSGGRSGKVPKFACYDARTDQRHGSTSNHTAMVRDPPSMTECIRILITILETMGDTPYSIVKKARAKFESPNEREYFVELTEVLRRDWVKDLEDDA